MSRRRVLVALVPPPRVVALARSLRWVLGDHRAERIVPHITLVPPFNVPAGGFDRFRTHVRSVVADTAPFEVRLGRPASFEPATPTVHLELDDLSGGVLARLRTELVADPHVPKDLRPFKPHLTIRSRAPVDQIHSFLEATADRFAIGPPNDGRPDDAPALDVGAGDAPALDVGAGDHSPEGSSPEGDTCYEAGPLRGASIRPGTGTWTVDSVDIMEQVHEPGVGTMWRRFAQEGLGSLVVIGRDGVELVIRTTSVPDGGFDLVDHEPGHGRPLCVTAESVGAVGRPWGMAWGHVQGNTAELSALTVTEDRRALGIGRQLLAHWIHGANRMGASLVWAESDPFLERSGFARAGRRCVRDLSGTTGDPG